MMGLNPQDSDFHEFAEVDPTGRYGRYNEILGKGASKIVYRAFDEYEGIEVAWNQVKLYDFLQSSEDLERLYCEIHLLKTLKHKNIMKFYTSWVDTSKMNINFITEMFTSGTLRQYRQKHRRVNIRAVKHWCRQILSALVYLHSHDPPVIHRDLKCDNIFINGNQGEVKIGDLGLAAILRKSHAVHCVGTPEFMAPEVYEEEYNELVDIYSFGMCVLEMLTFEYPYSECNHPVQIYKKVVSGTKPEALYRLKDPEVRQFVERCLATVSRRLSARELLNDPFLQIDDLGLDFLREGQIVKSGPFMRQPSYSPLQSNDLPHEIKKDSGWVYNSADFRSPELEFFVSQEENFANVDVSIKGRKREDGSIFLRLKIVDTKGHVRNIYFPFDTEVDTALGVATEMVAELDIMEYEVTRIADMIDSEVSSLVPDWKVGPGIEESPDYPTTEVFQNCASNVSSCNSFLDYTSMGSSGCNNLQTATRCSCSCMHGRFEEIMYQVEESEQCAADGAPSPSDVPDSGSQASSESQDHIANIDESQEGCFRALECDKSEDYENEIRQQLRWLKAKYQMEPPDYSNLQLGGTRASNPSPKFSNMELRNAIPQTLQAMKSFHLGTHFSFCLPPKGDEIANSNTHNGSCWSGRLGSESGSSPDDIMLTAKSFYAGVPLSNCLLRAKSLPVDVVDV